MSRIVKKTTTVPEGFSVETKGKIITIKSPKGQLQVLLPLSGNADADEGTKARLIANSIKGLTEGYSKVLEIQGTGYRAMVKDKGLEFSLGYSHQIYFEAPAGITLAVKDNRFVTVAGADKYLVGQVAANIRKLRQPDPYKGKGIRYQGEVIKLKPGKAAKAAE
jgi:large subunit ribosomal protein L6